MSNNMPVSNEEFYKLTQEYNEKYNFGFGDYECRCHSNFYAALDEFSNHEMTYDAIVAVWLFILDILNDKEDRFHISNDDAYRDIVKALMRYSSTKNIPYEGMKLFAFSIYYLFFIGKKNEVGETISRIDEFYDTDHIREVYENALSFDESLIIEPLKSDESADDFGLVPENPAEVTEIETELMYLDCLYFNDGTKIGIGDRTSVDVDKYDYPVDKYEILKNGEYVTDIYVYGHAIKATFATPKGFTMDPDDIEEDDDDMEIIEQAEEGIEEIEAADNVSEEEAIYRILLDTFDLEEIGLSEYDMRLNAQMLSVVSNHIHGKLTPKELVRARDFLGDVVTGHALKFAIDVPPEEYISAQARALEHLDETKGKLTMDEKMFFAFCVYNVHIVRVYNEETGEVNTGLTEVTTIESAEKAYQYNREMFPERYSFAEKDVEEPDDNEAPFGSEENPVSVVSVSDAYDYLNRLRKPGYEVIYRRVSSVSGPHGIMDKYQVAAMPEDDTDGLPKIIELYIDPYAQTNSERAPEGFELDE